MSGLSFDSDGKAHFPSKYNARVYLLKEKWDCICQEPERFYYKENTEKIATTLINPDLVRVNSAYKDQLVYYKGFDKVRINGQEIARKTYWAVIVNIIGSRIATIYPVDKPKAGKEYTGG